MGEHRKRRRRRRRRQKHSLLLLLLVLAFNERSVHFLTRVVFFLWWCVDQPRKKKGVSEKLKDIRTCSIGGFLFYYSIIYALNSTDID
tara:strand:- start:2143 stop:2406 length:264 start_codon:yes stop_codon:yes gene_type:complete